MDLGCVWVCEAMSAITRGGPRSFARLHVRLRVADDRTLPRRNAKRGGGPEDRIRSGLLVRHGVAAYDECEGRQEARHPERLHGGVVTLVRPDPELPRPKAGERLPDSGIGAQPLPDGLRLDPLKLPNGPHELVPDQAARS